MLEQEKRWDLIQQGRGQDYHGVAVHPRHLSLFEKVVLKQHHLYQPITQATTAGNASPPTADGNAAEIQQMNGKVLNGSMQVGMLQLSVGQTVW